jgi:hypothetical protein
MAGENGGQFVLCFARLQRVAGILRRVFNSFYYLEERNVYRSTNKIREGISYLT